MAAAAASLSSAASSRLHISGMVESFVHHRTISSSNSRSSSITSRILTRCAPKPRMQLQASRSKARSLKIRAAIGENPTNNPDDFVVLGLGHCFVEDSNGKLKDHFVIEPIGAGALECLENGGKTCYKHVASMHLESALKEDLEALPEELRGGVFCEDFAFRTKCAARSWMREYPQEKIVRYIPLGSVRSDFNYNLEDKRVLNKVNVVTDADNIKQDMSIDVYGRKKDDEENAAVTDAAPPSRKDLDAAAPSRKEQDQDLISSLYNA